MTTLVDGIDISFSAPSAEWAVSRWHEGNRIFVQCGWTGGYESQAAVKAVCERNLRTFREAGYLTLLYINANPDWGSKWEPEIAVTVAKANAGAEWDHLSEIVIDYEIANTPWERVWGIADAVRATGKRCRVIYTGKYVIDAAGQPDAAEFARYGMSLWRTGAAGSPPFAPWTETPVGWQMGETTLDGVKYDFNKFDLDFFAEAQPQEEDMSPEDVTKLCADAYAANPNGSFVRGDGCAAVYKIIDGCRVFLVNPAIAAAEGMTADFSNVHVINAVALNAWPQRESLE